MSEELKWVVTADDKDIIAAFKRMQKELENAKQKMKELGDTGEKAGKKQASAVDSSIASLGKMAAGWVSVQAAIQLANAEYQNYLDRQKEAAKETISTADAQIKFFRNMGNVSAEESRKIQAQVKAIAESVNAPAKNIYAVATKSISSAGKLSREEMFNNVAMAARLAPESLAEQESLATALGGTSRLTGSADPRINAGLLLQVGEQAPIPNMAGLASTLVPGAKGVAGFGGKSTDALALGSTLAMAAEDTTGAPTGTAMIALASQLSKFSKGKSADEAIAQLQANPAMRDKFLKGASFEKRFEIPVRDILTGGSETANLYAANKGKLNLGTAAATTDQFFQNVGAAPEQQVAAAERAFGARESQLQLGDLGGATAATNRAGLEKVLKASGTGLLAQKGAGITFEMERLYGRTPEAAAANTIEAEVKRRRDLNAYDKEAGEEASIKLLEQMVRELRGLRGDQKGKKNVNQHAER